MDVNCKLTGAERHTTMTVILVLLIVLVAVMIRTGAAGVDSGCGVEEHGGTAHGC